MKAASIPLQKDSRTGKSIQQKKVNLFLKARLKDQNTKRQRIVLSVSAGHVRGGHAFH